MLDAAVRLIARKGLRGLTIRGVAEEAHVTHGLVRYYFNSRDGLVHEAMVRAGAETIGETLEPHPDGLRRLRESFPDFIAETADLQAFQYELALEARRRPEYLKDALELYDRYHEAMASFLKGCDISLTPGLVRLVYAACDGLAFQQLLYGQPANSAEALETLEDVLRAYTSSSAGQAAE